MEKLSSFLDDWTVDGPTLRGFSGAAAGNYRGSMQCKLCPGGE